MKAPKVSDPVTFECPDCGRKKTVERCDGDHPTARICVLQCNRCDDGDFHEPEWFTADRKALEDNYWDDTPRTGRGGKGTR